MGPPVELASGLVGEGIPAMLDELEEHLNGGNRAAALLKATEVVEADPNCVEGLWALLNCGLPDRRRDGSYRVDPTLPEAAKGWALAKKIVSIDPTIEVPGFEVRYWQPNTWVWQKMFSNGGRTIEHITQQRPHPWSSRPHC